MCLILVAWRQHAGCPLVVAANRDEFHERPAARAAFWEDRPDVLGGRDLRARGTWLAVTRGGRFAAVTNYRGGTEPGAEHSRGALVTRFLAGTDVAALAAEKAMYSGFNLLASDGTKLWWLSNRDSGLRELEPGWYGLGNLLLDSPDVEVHKERLRHAPLSVEPLFRVLEPARIVHERYGTRCSTVLMAGGNGIRFAERAYSRDGTPEMTLRYELSASRIS